MSQLSDEILKEIKDKNISIRPKWYFALIDYLIWIVFALVIICGSLAIGTILFILTTHDWDIYDYLDRTLFQYILISIPYFWIFIFVLLVLFAYYIFAKTKRGYRYAVPRVFLGSIIGGLILGTVLFFLGVASDVHHTFSKNIPFYDALIYYREDIWNKPERGLISGEVTDIKNKNDFTLKDFDGNTWHVIGDNIIWAYDAIPQKGTEIKLIGQRRDDNNFYGRVVRPW